MLIIKPYGRSHTEFDDGKTPKRKIRRNPTPDVRQDTLVDVEEFAKTHPELIIAQWISAIDKIAAKPGVGKKPTPQQRNFRQKLGDAALQVLTEKNLLDLSKKEKKGERSLRDLWWAKIHPYDKDGKTEGRGSEKGYWYARFAGDVEVSAADPSAIAKKIHEHLHEREYQIKQVRPDKCQGRIAARAESIAKNVLALPTQFPDKKRSWDEQEEKAYEKAGDVATEIRRTALEKEKEGKGGGKFSVRDVAPILFAQYGRLFKNGNGKPLPIADAREKFPELFELHGAVKDTYTRILKNHRTLKNKKKESVVHALPAGMENLFRLVEAKSDNRDLNALVRLGKIIHYAATPQSGEDRPSNVIANWPDDLEGNRYRPSEGQAEIKRTEAFVRVWRNTIALAARTLTDWADPDGKIGGDILLNVKVATGEKFDTTAYCQKLPFLFGNRSIQFEREDDAFRKSVLHLALNGWAKLRHSSFHFKGRGGFVKALKEVPANADAVRVAHNLLKQDFQGQRDRLIKLLRGAHVEYYFDQEKLKALIDAVVNAAPPQSPMPRFRRVLERAKNAWKHNSYVLRLPPPDNRAELEKPGRQCRYVTVKTLYERPFPAWLEKQSAETLNKWINRAVQRTTADARSINNDECAVAKADGRIRLRDGEDIASFFDHLFAATATEFRFQRGYDSDADNARKQSKYIDDLRCDVVGQAFEGYLKTAGLSWVLDDLGDGPRPENKRSNLDDLPRPASDPAQEKPEDWEAVLYFLLHLVPVDAVGRLQHQLRKWSILEKKVAVAIRDQRPAADSAGRIFVLYLDMHDTKFEGSAGLGGAEALKSLFESEKAFSQACPGQPGQDAGRYVPWRGLREILRFGCLRPLMPIFREHAIGCGEVNKLAEWENVSDGDSRIVKRQKEREELHEKWVKKKLSDKDKTAYGKALADVVRHRHLAAHVRLNNHARLHSLLMGVLGRLVDYAGLWERDLYFTTLALVWRGHKKPNDVFYGKGLARLKEGRIVDALRELKKSPDNDVKTMVGQLTRLFGEDFLYGKCGAASVRNNLMHFNMLQVRNPVLNLTETVNDTRRLMAYDRKLKNAVSQSIKEMLAREGFDLTWEMRGHRLECAKIKVRQAIHLKDKNIKEDLHGDQFVKMAASLFCGEQEPSDDGVLSIDFDKIEWGGQHGQNPKGGRKTNRNQRGKHGPKNYSSRRKG